MNPTVERQLHLTIGSRFENIELVQMTIDETLRESGGHRRTHRHWIGLALREAVANAIKHGNRQDPSQAGRESSPTVSPAEVEIRVADEGAGFDPDAVRSAGAGEPASAPTDVASSTCGSSWTRSSYAFRPSGGTIVDPAEARSRRKPLAPQER